MAGNEDLFFVPGLGRHELVDYLVPLAGQGNECGHVGLGMACVVAQLLLIVGPVHCAVFDGNDGRRVQGVQNPFIDPLSQAVLVESLPALPRKRSHTGVSGALGLGRGTRHGI